MIQKISLFVMLVMLFSGVALCEESIENPPVRIGIAPMALPLVVTIPIAVAALGGIFLGFWKATEVVMIALFEPIIIAVSIALVLWLVSQSLSVLFWAFSSKGER